MSIVHASKSQDINAIAALTLADALTARGLDIWNPAWVGTDYLKITNAPGALSELTVTDAGLVTWEFRPFHGTPVDTGEIARRGLTLLGASPAGLGSDATPRPPRVALKDEIAHSLRACGLEVSMHTLDADVNGPYCEVKATNPGMPGRGRIELAEDGMTHAECRIRAHDGCAGVSLAEVASTICAALAS